MTLITGGAGFIGTNLADRIAREGGRVLIYDNLSRAGVERNLKWLKQRHGDRISVDVADIRDNERIEAAVAQAVRVFHMAAQVAVTTSLADPLTDFQINAAGTLSLLEALRKRHKPPPLVFASTNKLYGECVARDQLSEEATRYRPRRLGLRRGIDELCPIQLVSPYGCSKGAADQYVLDYARAFGIPAAVMRMSCIYGPRQFGTTDQGWVAHFVGACLQGETITVYGDGKQVRDILFVEDAVNAYLLVQSHMPQISGQVFNLGGGPRNAVSLLELLALLEGLTKTKPKVRFDNWRHGDQLYYVSDTTHLRRATGWQPTVSYTRGIAQLHHWLSGFLGTHTLHRERVPA
ncbi:SDR family NAD(P)-dependent oxidoreductase [Dongia deserti]|uniref:SDR family NAD(P)-dependent oxidoreductase n=1 Tax=Dongia deserti TaxID=2268030 RepID=UPI0025483B70|nr:SDR family NAD(P)-dependent oxidoreductase [Dongia deserti]